MKRYILKKRIFAIAFIVSIFGFSLINFSHNIEPIKEKIVEMRLEKEVSLDNIIANIELMITDNLYMRMKFVESYGFIQTVLDKRECNNFSYIKDEAGFLHYVSFYQEGNSQIFDYARRVEKLQDYAKKNGTKVLFAVPPSKYDPNFSEFRTGLPANDPNWIVDEMLFCLNRLGVETLDLRESIPNKDLSYEETFFKTDHHWTIPAAFHATKEITDKFKEAFNEDLDPQEYYTNIENYDIETYYSGMLGSMGRKTGANFSGIENFTALWPKFDGKYSRTAIWQNGQTINKQGNFIDTFMDTEVLTDNTDIYTDSQYSLYLNGICNYENIVNEENPDGVKILMIRDSYFSPIIAFLMPMCSQIDAIWSLEDTPELDIESYIKENEFDYIIIEVYPYNINDSAFNYFRE